MPVRVSKRTQHAFACDAANGGMVSRFWDADGIHITLNTASLVTQIAKTRFKLRRARRLKDCGVGKELIVHARVRERLS